MDCQMHLPLAGFSSMPDNATELRLGGRVPVVAGTSLYFYNHDAPSRSLLHNIKYYGHYKMALEYGSLLGKEISSCHRFDTVDMLVPVPLHWFKKLQRGYNQSELLCRGIAQSFPRPICTQVLYRKKYTTTQTHKNRLQRQDNMIGVFGINNAQTLEGKHILLIDDVITSGATTCSCWEALKQIPGIQISIASLAIVANP